MIRSLKTLATLTVLAGTVVAAGCDLTKLQALDDELDLILEIPGLSTTMVVQFVDGATGELVTGDLEVTVGGEAAASVIDPLFYDRVEKLSVSGGVVALGLPSGINATESNPVRFTVTAKAPGYLRALGNISVAGRGVSTWVVRMVKESAPPAGVVVSNQAGGVASSGVVTSGVTLTVPTGVRGAVTVTIPAGTALTTANGQPLQGALTTKVVYHSPESAGALLAFPGGMSEARVAGQPGGSTVISGGIASVEVRDASGRLAGAVSGATLTIPLPSGYRAPGAERPAQDGDELEVWRMDLNTGTWSLRGTGVVRGGHLVTGPGAQAAAAPGRRFSVERPPPTTEFRFLPDTYDGVLVSNSGPTALGGTVGKLEVDLTGPNLSHYRYSKIEISTTGWASSGRFRGLPGAIWEDVPSGNPFDVKVFDLAGRLAATKSESCTSSPCVISVPVPDPNLVTAEVALDVVCSGTTVLATYPFQFRLLGGEQEWTSAWLDKGRTLLPGVAYDQLYQFAASVTKNGRTTQKEWRVRMSEFSTPLDGAAERIYGERDGSTLKLKYRLSEWKEVCDAVS